jgi:hypothetical protein
MSMAMRPPRRLTGSARPHPDIRVPPAPSGANCLYGVLRLCSKAFEGAFCAKNLTMPKKYHIINGGRFKAGNIVPADNQAQSMLIITEVKAWTLAVAA